MGLQFRFEKTGRDNIMSSETTSASCQSPAKDTSTAGMAGQRRTNFRWALAIFAMLMTFMSWIDRVNLAVTAPAIIKELHFTKVQIGTTQTLFFVCYALFQIPSGALAEFFGHRRIVPWRSPRGPSLLR